MSITHDDDIREEPLARALGERYLAYALSTIMQRALPDVRDGLKPVHRRLIWAMRLLGLDPASGFKKCARVVGDVTGKFHPHGEQSVYDALVRLAQDFAVRYPLVEGQGNFGSIDGDNAAAMRYTEARLTAAAEALIGGIDEDAVDFRSTYDGEEREPLVLPAGFPNLLANGASGIAVGMATSVPPHNVGELCAAMLHLLKSPNAADATVIRHVQGPDFPTGGIIVDPRSEIEAAYASGRGSFRVRARWTREDQGRGTYLIVVTQMPYQVQKAKLIEKIAQLLEEKKLPLLADVRDESAEDVRLVLEPKSRTVEPELLMEQLFRLTELETRVSLNLNVLDLQGRPRVMSLKEALSDYLAHRREVLVRRLNFRLRKIETRLETLDGFLAVYLNLDKVIAIIREADEPRPALMDAFSLNENQADAILNMRLRNLRRLEEQEIRAEHARLTTERKEIRATLASEDAQTKRLVEEVKDLDRRFGAKTELGARRTDFAEAPDIAEIPADAFVEREPITVVCSQKGWIRALKGHQPENPDLKYKDGDRGRFWVTAQSTDTLILFATNGRFYALDCAKLPGGRGMGEPVRLSIDLPNDHDIVALFVHEPSRELLLASSSGHGFRVREEGVAAKQRGGKQVMTLGEGAEASVCVPADGDHLAVVGENRKLLVFPLSEVPEMARGRGVILQRYRDGKLADARCFALADGLPDGNGRTWPKAELRDHLGARGQAGRMVPKGFPKSGRLNPVI